MIQYFSELPYRVPNPAARSSCCRKKHLWLEISSLILSLCLLCVAVSGQYRFDQLTTDDGLPQSTVASIVQTGDGYLWLATLDGLVRYDGVRFRVFDKSNSANLPSNRIFNLQVDNEDSIWIMHDTGFLSRYRKGLFRAFSENDGLPDGKILQLGNDGNGGLLVRTTKGLMGFDGERFTRWTATGGAPDAKFLPYFSPSGARWELSRQSLTRYKDGIQTTYALPAEFEEKVQSEAGLNEMARLFEDRSGTLWLTLMPGHVFKLENGTILRVNADEMESAMIIEINQDADGNMWFATIRKGACRLNQNGLNCIGSSNGLQSNYLRKLFLDREGTFWFGTNNGGLYRLSRQVITPFSTAQGLTAKSLFTVYESKDGALWFGSSGAAARLKDGAITNFGTAEKLIYGNVLALLEDSEGRLWIGANEGVQYFKDGKFYDFVSQLSPAEPILRVFDIEQDERGVLLFGTSEGVIAHDGQTVRKLTTENGLPSNNVQTILKSRDGGYWLGTDAGLARWNDDRVVAYTEKDGLAGAQIRTLFEDDEGILWIGTYDTGLVRLKDGKFTTYNKANGLFSNGAFDILTDDDDNFWMSSNQGVYRVKRSELNELADGRRKFVTSLGFGKSDGMLNSEANGGGSPGALKTKDGRLWFPTQDGAAIVDPGAVKFNPLPPPVVIESVRINNQSVDPGTAIRLEPGQENLEIDYTGLSFIKSDQMRFRYRIEGLDDEWIEADTRRTASYLHIAPGDYVFRVIAANSDKVWNEQGASIRIIVNPAFYQTWWFIALAFLLTAGLGFVLYRRRISQLERERAAKQAFSRQLIVSQEQERKRVAAELHDSLGQSLAMIKNRAEFAVQNASDLDAAKVQLSQISEQSVDAINEVREISYNLRPYLLDRLGLTKALKSLLGKTAEMSGLIVVADIENVDRLFTPDEEISIYRVVQENLNNILKHADAREINVRIRRDHAALSLEFRDDGCGFVTDGLRNTEKKEGFGLLGMAERIRILGGSFTVDSKPSEGTSVNIKIDISRRINDDG